VEGVVHAAVIGQAHGANDPRWIFDINLGGTLNVLETIRADRSPRVMA
jgi:nucleoside-diphosphate-sugar epimerase